MITPGIDPAAAQSVDPKFWGTDGSVNAVVVSHDAVYVGGSFSSVAPVTGGGVPLTLDSGTPAPDFPKVDGYVYAAVPDGAGGRFIAGSFRHVAGLPRDNLAHVLADGTVADWNPGVHDGYSLPNAYPYALALNGTTLYLGGFFAKIGETHRTDLAAVDAITGELKSWDPEPSGFITSLLVVCNTLYVGGRFYNISGAHRAYIAAFDATTGSLRDWNPGANSGVNAIGVSGDVVYAGGQFTSIGGFARNRLAALDAKTGAVLPWNPAPDADVYTLAATGTSIFVGGDFTSIGGQARRYVAEVDASSGLATSWTTSASFRGVGGLSLGGSTLYAIGGNAVAALDAASGAIDWYAPLNGTGVVVAAADGDPERWSPAPHGHHDHKRGFRGTVYAGGDFSSVGERVPRASLAAFDLRTGAVTAWNPRANGPVNALAVSGGSVWAGGQFPTINGEPHHGLVALDPHVGAPSNVGLDADGYVLALAARGGTLYVGGRFTRLGGAARSNLAGVDARAGAVTGWDPGTNGIVSSLALGRGVLYVGGNFSLAGGGGSGSTPRGHAAAFHVESGDILPWDPAPRGFVNAIVPVADRVYLGGTFSGVGGQQRSSLAAVDRVTGALESWNPWPSNYDDHPYVLTLAFKTHALYVGGRFQFLGGDWRYHFGAVDDVTGTVTLWDPQMRGTALSLAVSGNTLFVGGGFNTVGGYPCGNFAVIRLGDDTPQKPKASDDSVVQAAGDASLACAPNPSNTGTVIRFTLPAAASTTVAVYDLAGRRIESLLTSESLPSGLHEVPVDTRGWRPGVYLCRMEAAGRSVVTKLLVTR